MEQEEPRARRRCSQRAPHFRPGGGSVVERDPKAIVFTVCGAARAGAVGHPEARLKRC